MAVLVAYEGSRGKARRAAEAIADAAAAHSVATIVQSIDDIVEEDFAAVDAVIAGCWTPGDVPFGGEPTQHISTWINGLAPLDGVPVGVFCTYSFFPHTFADTAARTAETLNEMSSRFELKGAKVVATRSIYAKSIDDGATDLLSHVLEAVQRT